MYLQPPFLTAEAAEGLKHARGSSVPVWLLGSAAAGTYWVARALHSGADAAGFASIRRLLDRSETPSGRVAEALAESENATLYVEAIERQPEAVQETILRWLDEGVALGGQRRSLRLVAQSESDRPRSLLAPLRHHLLSIVVRLPSLTERRGEVREIALAVGRETARQIGRPFPPLSDAELDSLADVVDVDELRARLIRRIVVGSAPVTAKLGCLAAEADAPAVTEGTSFESLVSELAHELRNPMVTIKTFAQHLDQLADDADLRDRFGRLTTEAVDRMDGFLDELLRFSRFESPRARALVLSDVLSQSIRGVPWRERVHRNGLPADVRVVADEEQLVFALRALLRGVMRQLPAESSVVLDMAPGGPILLRGNMTGGPRSLQTLLNPDREAAPEISLDFVLADSLIRRNRGSCSAVRAGDSLEVRLRLPSERSADSRGAAER